METDQEKTDQNSQHPLVHSKYMWTFQDASAQKYDRNSRYQLPTHHFNSLPLPSLQPVQLKHDPTEVLIPQWPRNRTNRLQIDSM